MSARMSLSENTAAKRMLGLACAPAPTAYAAARAAPALSAERRSILKFMPVLLLGNGDACSLVHEIAENHVADHAAPASDIALRAHLPLEDGGESMLVGDVEHAERRDRLVDFHRIDVAPEASLRLPPRDDARQGLAPPPRGAGPRRTEH